MNTIVKSAVVSLLLGLSGLQGASAANLGESDLDTRFSAKIAKERTRATTLQQQQGRQGNGSTAEEQQCGSQNIGNVNTGGRIGSQPREVFVFAPNSVNVVTGRGCR